MSSREPLWFCHECNAEMRPLMVPDPVCASCRGGFVEKMEDPADDPREFSHSGPTDFDAEGLPPGIDTFLMALHSLMDRGMGEGRNRTLRDSTENATPSNRISFQIHTGSGGRSRSVGRPGDENPSNSIRPPTMSEFLRRGSDSADGPAITGPIMAQYLMALLGHRDPMNEMFGRGIADLSDGRMGDYVFNQEALDHIITQLMENSNAHRPVPATEEIISNLPREVLEFNSYLLEKDCAVCKEQFKLETEDPDEQIVLTLPCKHPFHEPCILPWLKSSGTCPVCRYALVPQPEHHSPASAPRRDSSELPRSTSPSISSRPTSPDTNGLLQSLFRVGGFGRNGNPSAADQESSTRHRRSSSDHNASTSDQGPSTRSNLPGGWNEDLD